MKYFRLKSTLSLFFTTTKNLWKTANAWCDKGFFFPPQYILLYQLSSLNVMECYASVCKWFLPEDLVASFYNHLFRVMISSIVVGVCLYKFVVTVYIDISTCHSRRKMRVSYIIIQVIWVIHGFVLKESFQDEIYASKQHLIK